jgi:hypothetical protein
MVIRHRLSSRTASSTLHTCYDAELLSRPIRRNDAGDVYIPAFTDHTILSTLTAE